MIRDALGHTSLAVTDRHLRDVAPMQVIDRHDARPAMVERVGPGRRWSVHPLPF